MLANFEACRIDLKTDLPLLFETFEEALAKTNKLISNFPPTSRARILEASIIQSCFAEFLFKNFGDKAFYGKHKRLVLRLKGYIILFKKLDRKGLPMNITTTNVQSILNQNKTLDLFADSVYSEDPILYFGYQKTKLGELVNPQLIYIDEEQIKFSIGENEFGYVRTLDFNPVQTGATPRLKTKVETERKKII